MVSHNHLTILDKDLHGLPVLCYADLGNNRIVALGRELVSKTRCKIGHGVHEGTWGTLKIDMQGKWSTKFHRHVSCGGCHDL